MGAGLVGDDVDLDAAANDFGQDIGAVANESDREGATFAAGGLAEGERFVKVLADGVAVACVNAALDAACDRLR